MTKKLICPKCKGFQKMSIIKAIPKRDSLILAMRCPICKSTKKVSLSFSNKQDWIEDVRESFFMCDLCGAINKDSLTGFSHYLPPPQAYWYYYGRRKKIIFRCNNCDRARVKVTSVDFWSDLEPFIYETKERDIKTKEDEIIKDLKCPQCGNKILKTDKICPNCGLELICDKCGAPIVPGAKFCSNCGEKVKTFNIKEKKLKKEKICPACHEKVSEGQIFCSRCGQELICDKCGAELLEGAYYCHNCGDPVKMGELD
ncbi:MAG: double zinc ribbon domain-containing protein [Candidatus Helarchaeota archaeon]